MADQVKKLERLGISAVCLSLIKDEGQAKCVEEGVFSVVYGTPETFLKNERWRKMIASDLYGERTCAVAVHEAHVIKQWCVF